MGRRAIITPEQRAKGTYEGDQRIVNRGGTPVMRWLQAGKLSETQALAIQLCYSLWGRAGITQRVTANYGDRLPGNAPQSEDQANSELTARRDLHRVQGYFNGLEAWWGVFENVCRFDEPAGVAGSKLGFGNRSAEDRAHTTVCFVADIIATKEGLIPVARILSA